ncbi:MAG: patatin-like phospholipase family protein [Bacteroidales bacterium]|nr:patatin-like phospholipase family protein [Bacteroidales bacterium]
MKANLLSLDSGGIRAIATAKILVEIENRLIDCNNRARLTDYFDLVAASGMSAVIAAMLTTPDQNGRPKYKAQDILSFFLNEGSKIFDVSLWKKLSSIGGLTDEKYSASYLDKVLNQYFGDTMLSNTTTALMITAYDIRNRAARIFATTDTRIEGRNFRIKDICRASMATPSYFEPAKIKSATDTPYTFIDGGLFAANPGMTAYAEARRINFTEYTDNEFKPNKPGAESMFFVSIGTGHAKRPYYYEEAKDWGNIHWLKPIIDIANTSNIEINHFILNEIFKTCSVPDDYIRLSPDLVQVSSHFDDTSDANINAIIESSDIFIDQHKELLDNVANKLISFSK